MGSQSDLCVSNTFLFVMLQDNASQYLNILHYQAHQKGLTSIQKFSLIFFAHKTFLLYLDIVMQISNIDIILRDIKIRPLYYNNDMK
jgi:hypothetical protein